MINAKKRQEAFENVFVEAEKDPEVIGFVLGGGRGKGVATDRSDYDISIIVSDKNVSRAQKKYREGHYVTEVIDIHVFSLSDFRKYAAWGMPDHIHAYNFAHLVPQIDRTGEIKKLIEEKSKIPESEIHQYTSGQLDGFINAYYRALKNNRDGNMLAAHLDAVESLSWLLSALFGCAGRLRPYNKFLEWELLKFPLPDFPWDEKEFLNQVKSILSTGDMKVMKSFYQIVKVFFLKKGYEKTIRGWDGYDLG